MQHNYLEYANQEVPEEEAKDIALPLELFVMMESIQQRFPNLSRK